ncbi:MAG: hypothetical protein R6X20_04565 [Phycisphaerae bacterium]
MSLRRPLLCLVMLSLAAGLCPSCAEMGEDAWQPPRIVRIEGAENAYSVSPMYGTLFGSVIEKDGEGEEPFKTLETTTYVLARPGELVALKDGGPFPYAAEDGTSLSVQEEQDRVTLGGRKVAVNLDDEEAWTWLAQAPEADLAALRMIHVGDVASEEGDAEAATAAARQALARLAEVNPRVGVALEDGGPLAMVLEQFDPPWLSLDGLVPGADLQDRLAGEPHLHTLLMKADAEGGLGFLARLPHVRTLFLTQWEGQDDEAPPATLPTMPSLRTLIVFGAKMKDLGPVGTQPNLEELVVALSESLADLGRLTEMPGLRALVLTNCKAVKDLSALASLRNLQWLGLPPATTQEEFARICTDHPGLVVLQADTCKRVSDLSPVKGLRRLQVLTVSSPALLGPLTEPTPLRLLGLGPMDDDGDGVPAAEKRLTETLVQVMEANPDLAVVQVSPLCLGSGWILLLVPATAAAWWLARRRRSGTVGRHG